MKLGTGDTQQWIAMLLDEWGMVVKTQSASTQRAEAGSPVEGKPGPELEKAHLSGDLVSCCFV